MTRDNIIFTYVTVHAKRDHKWAKYFFEITTEFALLFPFLPSYKFVRHSSFTSTRAAKINNCRNGSLHVIRNVSGYASAYFLVENTRL